MLPPVPGGDAALQPLQPGVPSVGGAAGQQRGDDGRGGGVGVGTPEAGEAGWLAWAGRQTADHLASLPAEQRDAALLRLGVQPRPCLRVD